MISFRSMSVSVFALVAALAGCSGEAGASAGASTANATAALNAPSQQAAEGHRHFAMHRGGPDFLIHAALHEPINLTDAQRATIEGLAKPNPSAKPAFDADHAKKLAAAIRTNTVEQLQPPAQDPSARDAHLAAAAAKLQTLHDTLTAEQRTQLVDAIAKRAAEHDQKGQGREHEGKGEHARGGFERGPMHMLEGLDLSQAQKDAIKAKLDAERPAAPTEEQKAQRKAQHEAMRTARQAQLQAFKGNSFDAKAFVTPPQGMEKREHKGNALAVITSVLTPAQREQLAKRIEEGPARFQPRNAPASGSEVK